jgi:hypothetical protein
MRRRRPDGPLEPLVESGVVSVGETLTGIDTVEQGMSSMVCRDPDSIGVRDEKAS